MSRVETVLGPIEPDKLGVTMTHEHSLIDMTSWFRMPTEASRKWIAKAKVEIGILERFKTRSINMSRQYDSR